MKNPKFNLEEAKAGHAIMCAGNPAVFIAHVPELPPHQQVLARINNLLIATDENGENGPWTLTMAPKKHVRSIFMKLRYKKSLLECESSSFNVCSIDEVLTGDDSATISDLDCFLLYSMDGLSEREKEFKKLLIKISRDFLINPDGSINSLVEMNAKLARDLLVKHGVWKDFRQAFKDRDVIPDNFNAHFSEPTCDEDREKGYSP